MSLVAFFNCGAVPKRSKDHTADTIEIQIFEAINRQRRVHNIAVLEWDDRLAEVARAHSTNMMRRGFFAHQDPLLGDLADRLNRAKIGWRACAENIYQERGLDDPANTAVTGWIHSTAHRHNLLDAAYTRTGVGAAVGRDGTYFFTQVFIKD